MPAEDPRLAVLDRGGCRCDPPGAGEESCTGHCILRAALEEEQAGCNHADLVDERDELRLALARLVYLWDLLAVRDGPRPADDEWRQAWVQARAALGPDAP